MVNHRGEYQQAKGRFHIVQSIKEGRALFKLVEVLVGKLSPLCLGMTMSILSCRPNQVSTDILPPPHAVFSGCRSNLRKTQGHRLTTLPDGADNTETVVSTICLVNTITMIISI